MRFLLITAFNIAAFAQQSVPAAGKNLFQAVNLPDPAIPGFRFPESAGTVNHWVKTNNQDAIAAHAWGLWAALTEWSGQSTDGEMLRVFETWQDRNDFLTATDGVNRSPIHFSPPTQLHIPDQFSATFSPGRTETWSGMMTGFVPFYFFPQGINDQKPFTDGQSLKFNPQAGVWINAHNLFSLSALNKMLNDQRRDIPGFKKDAIALKPIFKTIAISKLISNRYFQLRSWSGPPPLVFNDSDQMYHSSASNPNSWLSCVWIDFLDPDKEGIGASNCSSRTDSATYGINQFIHFRLSARIAALANTETGGSPLVSAGDYAILEGMHVTTKEIQNWTWQTFWWADQPTNPPAPSSPDVAKHRPIHSDPAALHYAQCSAYEEVRRSGESLYCYNPYLEAQQAGFINPKKFSLTRLDGKLVKTPNDVGVQTNCMSCHANANFQGGNTVNPTMGAGAVDRNTSVFQKTLRLDFLWSFARESK